MAKIYNSFLELVGNTPLYCPKALIKKLGLNANLLFKLESFNPAHSAKDRAALYMIKAAEKSGQLKQDSVIIEPTSGNTGIALCAICSSKGYKTIIVMPSNMSEERIKLMRAFGAEVILTPAEDGMSGAIKKAEEIAKTTKNAFIPAQFENKNNALAHYKTTGPEIYADTNGEIDFLVCGVGTGGTITGAGKYLKEQKGDITVVAVEPSDSAVLSGKNAGKHAIQGIGAGFVPKVLDTAVIDKIITVTKEEAYEMARIFAKHEGLLVGISSGAAIAAAVKLAKENCGKTIVSVLADTGERYLSTDLF